MKNPLHFLTLLLILALFAGCRDVQIAQKDIFSEIKLKGKYKNPRKIDVVNEISLYKADSLFQKMTKIEFDTLQFKDKYHFQSMGCENFYYSFEERENYYMLFIYIFKNLYPTGIDVIIYNKKWEIIDTQELSINGTVTEWQPYNGKENWGIIWNSKCDFIDENTFNIIREESYGSYQDEDAKNIREKSITKYKISPNGKIDSLSTKYLIKDDSCYQKGIEFMDRTSKK